jgi:integrase
LALFGMARIYKKESSSFYYADIRMWDEKSLQFVRRRVSTKMEIEEEAQAFAEQMERASETAKVISNQTITKEHVEKIVMEILAAANIHVSGSLSLPLIVDFFSRYLDICENKVKLQTYRLYKGYDKVFQEWLPNRDLRLDWLTKSKLEDYYNYLISKMSPKTAKEKFRYVSRVLDSALDEYLSQNPAKKVSMTRQKDELGRQPLTMAEVKKIINYLNSDDDKPRNREWARAVMLSVSCGCRLEDAVNMWSKNITKGILKYTQLKTGKSITCPIVVKEWLKELTGNIGYICPELAEDFAARQTAHLSSEFTELVAQAGVKQSYKTFDQSGRRVARKTFHSLRHTLRTAIVSSGGSDAQADLILGHSSGQGKTYTHSETGAMESVLLRVFKDS